MKIENIIDFIIKLCCSIVALRLNFILLDKLLLLERKKNKKLTNYKSSNKIKIKRRFKND
jgi:hypothetical protein